MSIPRPEYPRPDMVRGTDSWLNLNGSWFFERDCADSGIERGLHTSESYSEKISVPFVPESAASGIGCTDFMRRVWYCRSFSLPQHFDLSRGRVLLHIGAMDYEGTVWINGAGAGSHRGGYTPCETDITELLHRGENRINISCADDTRSPLQPSGKQSGAYKNSGCFYTRCTGIWQTVWLEYVPEIYIRRLKLTPDVHGEKLDAEVYLSANATVTARASYKGEPVSEVSAAACAGVAAFSLPVPEPRLWQPGKPELYDIEISAGDDRVVSYFGMRTVETDGQRVLLNGKSIFMRTVLDQGYYPEGIYTAPSDEALARDIELAESMGFNGARMHMKIFEPRYLYHADKAGFLLWGEYPNWGLDIARPGALDVMLPEWLEALKRDYNHPSVIGWCPFNEAFPGTSGIYDTVYNVTKSIDARRPVIDTSGYVHAGKTDIFDVHDYEQDPAEFARHYPVCGEMFYNTICDSAPYDGSLPYYVSEMGGAFWDMDAAARADGQDSGNPWGYGKAPESEESFLRRYEALVSVLLDNPAVCGFCWTQFTDVMQEMNGLLSFDRRAKFDTERIRRATARAAAIEL